MNNYFTKAMVVLQCSTNRDGSYCALVYKDGKKDHALSQRRCDSRKFEQLYEQLIEKYGFDIYIDEIKNPYYQGSGEFN